ncbi:hypothetical protein PRUPE_1G074300 [Prunus persica]|uniref:Uncharacterized protein n=1 Tax=Prunus persica TaxID=3760 RepID=A0A251QWU2_PRUPE|nr:hypothetical protein PRUPE_1G074300 [Prunus persica]
MKIGKILKTSPIMDMLKTFSKVFKKLSWSCESMGSALIIQSLRELIRFQNPSMVFLMETKQNIHRKNRLRQQLGFWKGFHVDPIGQAGG